jgi:Tropinone reductase 1
LVTGGTKGIGRAIAEELRLLGAEVVIVARTAPDIATSSFPGVATDLSEPTGAAQAVAFATETLGGLDIVVSNVGTNIRKPTMEYADTEYETLFATNLESAWRVARAAHPALVASGSGCLVQIGSVAGTLWVGSGAPYAMTKAALDQLTRYLAVEWATDGIRVNAVNPWYTHTPLANFVLDNPEFAQKVVDATPLGRIAEPADIAAVVAFLCLPAARHLTGQCLSVDGGFLARGW